MTSARIIVRGATTALTRRTTLRKAWLAPWHPLMRDIHLYSLADAQRHTDVAVHHTTRVVTHHHTTVTPSKDNLPELTRRFHRDVSCAVHTLLCRERYDAPRNLFDDRPTHQMRLVDAAAQAGHLVYEHLNCVAAGLVARPEHMPQYDFDFGLWKTGYLEVERPPVFFGSDRPRRLRLYLTPPPELYRAFGGDLDALVHHMKKLSEDGIRALAAARTRQPLGARAVRRLHPWSEPRTLRESGGKPVPTFRIGARGIVGTQQRIEGALEVRGFRQGHRRARVARREGDAEARFPFGTYGARVYDGAPVEPQPGVGAIVTRPGPTLAEVQAELDAMPAPTSTPHDLVDAVRDALREEADELAEHAAVELATASQTRVVAAAASAASGEETPPEAVVVRHRFDRRDRQRPEARRVITLRDQRRGRPRRGDSRHGGDPPH